MTEDLSQTKGPGEDPRVRFAAERTLLAWIRTGLGFMGFGFVVARFGLFLRELEAARQAPVAASTGVSLWLGIALALLGVTVTFIAAMHHVGVLRRLSRGEPYVPPTWSLSVAVALLTALLGVGLVVYLLLVAH